MRIFHPLFVRTGVTATMLAALCSVSHAEQSPFDNAKLAARLTELGKITQSRCVTLPELPHNPICRDAVATANLATTPGFERSIAYVMKCSTAGPDCALDGTEDTLRKWVIGSQQPDARLRVLYINDSKTGLTTAVLFWFRSIPAAP